MRKRSRGTAFRLLAGALYVLLASTACTSTLPIPPDPMGIYQLVKVGGQDLPAITDQQAGISIVSGYLNLASGSQYIGAITVVVDRDGVQEETTNEVRGTYQVFSRSVLLVQEDGNRVQLDAEDGWRALSGPGLSAFRLGTAQLTIHYFEKVHRPQ